MTNKGSSACAMEGSPDVDLIGDTSSQPSYDWPLARTLTKGAVKVTLQPGATAHFDLVYLPVTPPAAGTARASSRS